MFVSSRIAKTLAATFIGAAVILCTGAAGGVAQAQISGSTGGNLVDAELIEEEGIFFEVPSNPVIVSSDEIADAVDDGTSNTIMYALALDGLRGARITADVTTTDAAGGPHTTRIIAILIGLFAPRAPGLSDYALDACRLSDGGAATDAEWRSCALITRRFSAFMAGRRLAVSPAAVMAQTARGIAIWDPR
jgi:hypothetical protein